MRIPEIWRRSLLCLCASLVLTAGARADDTLVSVTPDGWLVSFDPQTGAISQYHVQLPEFSVEGAAWSPADSKIYMIVVFAGSTQYFLYSLDPATLQLTRIAALPGINGPIGGAAYDPGSHNILTLSPGGPDAHELYSIDPHAGSVTLVAGVPLDYHAQPTGFSFDSANRFLYVLYYSTGPADNSAVMNLLRLDPTQAQPPVITPLRASFGQLQGLVPIPGTTGFYTSTGSSFPVSPPPTMVLPTFDVLDTSSLTLTTLASSFWGSSAVRPLLFRNFTLAAEPPATGALTYSIRDLCFPASCQAAVLNDNGEVAGWVFNGTVTPFAIYNATGLTYPAIPNTSMMAHMNNSGVFVGEYRVPAGDNAPRGAVNLHGYAYVPQGGQFYELNPVTGVTSGFANYINDLGQITGSVGPNQTVFGLPSGSAPLGITDDGIVIGMQSQTGASGQALSVGFIARPGLPVAYLSPYQQITGFNRSGHVIGSPLFLYNPDGSKATLPAVTPTLPGAFLSPVAINDSGLILFDPGGPDTLLFDSSGAIAELSKALAPLHTIVSPASGWSNLTAIGINNGGQILVQGVSTVSGRKTSLLLSPSGLSGPASKAAQAFKAPRREPICGVKSVNGLVSMAACR